MQIKNPISKRGMPRENGVIEVVRALCKKCGYDEENVVLNHIGGDRKFKFSKRGVKLIKPHPFTVEMFIGCGDETVQTNFELKNGGGRAVSGDSLFQAMETTFGGRIFLLENEKQENVHEEVGEASENAATNLPADEQTVPELAEPVLVGDTASVAAVSDQTQSLAPEESHQGSYKGYFKNEDNLHTAVLGLVAKFEVNVPFGFDEFTKILSDEVGIVLQPQAMGSMVQVFTSRGYIVRLNPKVSPARYALTDEAVAFVSNTNMLLKKANMPARKKEVVSTEPVLPVTTPSATVKNVANVLSELRQNEAEYQKSLSEIKQLETEINQFKADELESEERNLMGEVRSLEARLEVISGRLREINQAKADQGERENKIAGLLDSPRYKELLARHKEYEEYRKLLLGEAS